MTIVAIYLLFGCLACTVDVAISSNTRKQATSIFPLLDPFMIVAWPIMLLISAIERMQPPAKKIELQNSEPKGYSNKTGTVVVELRPAGKVRVENAFLVARSRFGVVAVGCRIQVGGKELGELIVEEAK